MKDIQRFNDSLSAGLIDMQARCAKDVLEITCPTPPTEVRVPCQPLTLSGCKRRRSDSSTYHCSGQAEVLADKTPAVVPAVELHEFITGIVPTIECESQPSSCPTKDEYDGALITSLCPQRSSGHEVTRSAPDHLQQLQPGAGAGRPQSHAPPTGLLCLGRDHEEGCVRGAGSTMMVVGCLMRPLTLTPHS